MNSRQIDYFLAVVDQGISFTKAATKLYITQPSLSKQINNLEKELDVTLFDTSKKRSVELTPAGKLYYDFFNETRDELKKINSDAINANRSQYVNISIVCVNGWNINDIIERVNHAKSTMPMLDIKYYSKPFFDIMKSIDNDVYDIAFTTADQFKNRTDMKISLYAKEPMALLYSKKNPLASKKSLQVADFHDEPLYVLDSDESPEAIRINTGFCRKYNIEPKVITMPNLDSIYASLESGSGFMLIDDRVMIKDHPDFAHIKIDGTIDSAMVFKKSNSNPNVKWLVEFLISH